MKKTLYTLCLFILTLSFMFGNTKQCYGNTTKYDDMIVYYEAGYGKVLNGQVESIILDLFGFRIVEENDDYWILDLCFEEIKTQNNVKTESKKPNVVILMNKKRNVFKNMNENNWIPFTDSVDTEYIWFLKQKLKTKNNKILSVLYIDNDGQMRIEKKYIEKDQPPYTKK